MREGAIGLFDSGVGGLNVLRACASLMPNESYYYLMDKSNAPYGNRCNAFILDRASFLTDRLIAMGCKAVIVACNTATAVAIDVLRKQSRVPVFGVEPAVLPAVKASMGGEILVLTTRATAIQQRFISLVNRCNSTNIYLLPQDRLAGIIDENITNLERIRPYVYRIFMTHSQAESVVLGCTHYEHVYNQIMDFYRGKIKIYDSSGGVAKAVERSLRSQNLLSCNKNKGKTHIFTL